MTFETLSTITEDLLRIIRGANISASENISRRQIENWVHQYRALLLKRDLDKGKYTNPDYIQEIPFLSLEQVSLEGNGVTLGFDYTFDFPLVEGGRLPGDNYLLRTTLPIPKTIDLNYKSGLMFVGNVSGDEIQLVPEQQSRWKKYKRCGKTTQVAYKKIDGKIYITNDDPDLQYISIRGIFENPAEVSRFINPNTTTPIFTLDTKYPIPNSLVPVLKEMILSKELEITVKAPTDLKNDSNNGLSNNIER